jgi:hypothetical protein
VKPPSGPIIIPNEGNISFLILSFSLGFTDIFLVFSSINCCNEINIGTPIK